MAESFLDYIVYGYWIRLTSMTKFRCSLYVFALTPTRDSVLTTPGLRDSVVNRIRRVETQLELYTRTFCIFVFTLKQL